MTILFVFVYSADVYQCIANAENPYEHNPPVMRYRTPVANPRVTLRSLQLGSQGNNALKRLSIFCEGDGGYGATVGLG